MPNGKPGDHPLNDLFHHSAHPFPPDIEELVRQLAGIDPILLGQIDQDVFSSGRRGGSLTRDVRSSGN